MAAESPKLLDHSKIKYRPKTGSDQRSAFKKKSNIPFPSEFSDFTSDFPYNPVFDPIKLFAAFRVRPIWPYRYRYSHTDIQQTDTDTDTPFQNLYQTDTDTNICFEIHIKPIPIPIIGIYLY